MFSFIGHLMAFKHLAFQRNSYINSSAIKNLLQGHTRITVPPKNSTTMLLIFLSGQQFVNFPFRYTYQHPQFSSKMSANLCSSGMHATIRTTSWGHDGVAHFWNKNKKVWLKWENKVLPTKTSDFLTRSTSSNYLCTGNPTMKLTLWQGGNWCNFLFSFYCQTRRKSWVTSLKFPVSS